MKRILIIFTFSFFLLAACAPAQTTETNIPTPTETAIPVATYDPSPVCTKNYCLQDAYISLEENILLIQIAMTDEQGDVPIGFDVTPNGTIFMAVYLDDGSALYLIGFKLEPSQLTCYTGNDVPWTNGTLGRACSITVPATSMAQKIDVDTPLRVEVSVIPELNGKFNKPAIWLQP